MNIQDALARVIARDPRFTIEAYAFVLESLQQARGAKLRRLARQRDRRRRRRPSRGGEPERSGHVNGPELCEAARRLALRQWGSMAPDVLARWGLRSTSDIGDIVYNLIASGDLDKTPSDRRSDFDDVFDFATAMRIETFVEDAPEGH